MAKHGIALTLKLMRPPKRHARDDESWEARTPRGIESTAGADSEASDECGSRDARTTLGADVDDALHLDAEDYKYARVDRLRRKPMPVVRLATLLGLVFVLGLAGLGGWMGYRLHESYESQQQRQLLIQTGRQGALNLTTIDWQHADADVQRILKSATGTFYDDFAKRSQSFIDVVEQAQSKSVGTIAEAGLESVSGSEAQVLVAVKVHTTNAGAPEQNPREWRMRISVQKVGDEAKVSNVAFVP
jgi:Mce-associated membrane protein